MRLFGGFGKCRLLLDIVLLVSFVFMKQKEVSCFSCFVLLMRPNSTSKQAGESFPLLFERLTSYGIMEPGGPIDGPLKTLNTIVL